MDTRCAMCHHHTAKFRCYQCHRPVCDECSFKDENGAFCSRNCAAQYREFRRSEAARGGRQVSVPRGLLYLIILGAIAAAVAWWMGWLRF